jgi:acetyl esterase
MAVDPGLQGVLDFLEQVGAPPMSQGTAEQARAGFRALTVDSRDPAALPPVASVEPATAAGRPARVYRPSDEPLPTIVLFHGGGWVIGDLDTHDLNARLLATRCQAVVVSVDYRLAPEHPFPAAALDAVAATNWAFGELASLGGTDRLAVAGDSAGGNLAAVAAQAMRDEGVPLAGQLLLYPATDVGAHFASYDENGSGYFLDLDTMAWFMTQYAGAADPADPRLSPAKGDLSGLAPAVVAVAGYDPLRDDGLAYAAALSAAGVPVTVRNYESMIHGFFDMGLVAPGALAASEDVCAAFRDVLHG